MSDPRARITQARRELSIGPPPTRPDVAVTMPGTPLAPLPGKTHGRKRSVGLHLPGPVCDYIRQQAASQGTTLADIVLTAVENYPPEVTTRRRPGIRRNLDQPRTLFILLTTTEADTLARQAAHAGTSMSAIVTGAFDVPRS